MEAPEAVNRLFLDKSGQHVLVATESCDLYYYARKADRFRFVARTKANMVTAVGWNQNGGDESSVDCVLVGTKRGVVYELNIAASVADGFAVSNWRSVTTNNQPNNTPTATHTVKSNG